MDAMTRWIAMSILRQARKRQADYDQDVRDWYAAGDGRSPAWITEHDDDGTPRRVNMGGQGYRYPACIHGTSTWTEYDNICGPCEDGPVDVHKLALAEARRIRAEYDERDTVLATLEPHRHTLLDTTWKDLQTWAWAPLAPTLDEGTAHHAARQERMDRFRNTNRRNA
jgi:hypothetical protein